MGKKEIKTDKAPAPIGPYSQAVQAGGFIFCSGQIALDPLTGKLDDSDVESETIRVMENLKAVLEAEGSSLDRVVKTTIFLRDMSDFKRINSIYALYFNNLPPARSTVQVASLPKSVSVEIDCIALAKDL